VAVRKLCADEDICKNKSGNMGLEKLHNGGSKQYIVMLIGMWHASDNRNVCRISVGEICWKETTWKI
jgi:hypothetical protein